MLEFDARIGGGEAPVNGRCGGIAGIVPGEDFLDEGRSVWNAAIQAWPFVGGGSIWLWCEFRARLTHN